MRFRSRHFFIGLFTAACLLPAVALAGKDIYRCDVGGRITYTDHGCTGQGEAAVVVAMLPASAGTSTAFQSERLDALPVVPGMSPRAVFETLGRPVETIATLQGRTLIEYWLYRRTSGVGRVAFQDGRVTWVDMR